MTHVDRRGLAEVVAWSCTVVMTGIVLIVAMLTRGPEVFMLAGLFSGAVTALVSRGTKGAIDRDAQRDQRRELDANGR